MKLSLVLVAGVVAVERRDNEPISVPLIPYVKKLKMPSFEDVLNKQLALNAHENEIHQMEHWKYSFATHDYPEPPRMPPPQQATPAADPGRYGNPAITDMDSLRKRR